MAENLPVGLTQAQVEAIEHQIAIAANWCLEITAADRGAIERELAFVFARFAARYGINLLREGS